MTMPILRDFDAMGDSFPVNYREAANYTAKSTVSARNTVILPFVARVVAGLMSIW
jgi:hypothetical protein